MHLTNTNQSVVASLADDPNTVAPSFFASYHGAQEASRGTVHGSLAAEDTDYPIVPAPSSNEGLTVDTFMIHNADDAAIALTISFKESATKRPFFNGSLAVGDTLIYAGGQIHVLDSVGRVKSSGSAAVSLVLADGEDLELGDTTGSKIGTAASQKLGFWNATPIVQPASADQAEVDDTAATQTTPYGFATAEQADGLVTLVNALRAALVDAGLIKGAA